MPLSESPAPSCPQCGTKRVANIVYGDLGLPTVALGQAMAAGRVELGGTPDEGELRPRWHCRNKACGARW